MSEFADKARTIGVSLRRGSANRKTVIDERDGSVAGHELERWDDSQDAHAIMKPVRIKARRPR